MTYNKKLTSLACVLFSTALMGNNLIAATNPAALLPIDCMANAKIYPSRDYALNVWPKDSIVAEVGIFRGEFSKKIIDIVQPQKLHLLDINLEPFNRTNITGYEEKTQIQEGDSSTLLATYNDGFFDVIYIDGDHRYEGCKKDAVEAFKKLKVGGLLVFNDYTHFDQFACRPYGMPYGVPAVAHEMLLDPSLNLTISYLALQPSGFYDLGLLKN